MVILSGFNDEPVCLFGCTDPPIDTNPARSNLCVTHTAAAAAWQPKHPRTWDRRRGADLTGEELAAVAAQIEADAKPLFSWLMVKIMRAELDGHGWGDAAA